VAERSARVTGSDSRLEALILFVERLALRDYSGSLPISPERDAIDAMAYGLNFLAGELERAERADDELRRLAHLVETSNDAFVGSDLDGKVNLWNAAAERVFGYSKEEILGQPLSLLVPAELRATEGSGHQALGSTSERDAFVTERCAKSGERISVSVQMSPQHDRQGEVMGSYGIVRDITAQRRADDALRRANQAKDDFMATMSHELRTPLNAILGFSEVLRTGTYGPLSGAQDGAVESIEQSGRHLLELVSDILDFARLGTDRVALAHEEVDVRALIGETVRMLAPQAKKGGVALSDEPGAADRPTVLGDPRRLRQVLLNLATNAVKFTPPGGSVGIEVRGGEHAVAITIWDTGPGIAADQLELVFEPFVQVESGLTRAHQGSGLGLALARRLARLMGGEITLESEIGRGSRFTLTLPLGTAGSGAARGPAATRTRPRTRHRVADEHEPTGRAVRDELVQLGAEVQVAHSERAMLSAATAGACDLVVLDIVSPERLGAGWLRSLRARGSGAAVPVLTLSADNGAAIDNRTAHLQRPATRDAFRDTVRALAPAPARVLLVTDLPLILITDDRETNIRPVADFLRVNGFRVETAHDGLSCVEKARTYPPSLILLDVQMPDMDGFETLRRLGADPATREVPVIALTALAMAGDRERCLAAGAVDYLAKPVSLRALRELLIATLEL